jgi:hypothetical protein
MTVRKVDNLLRGDRTPAYVNRETGAAELLISPDTWDQWVKEGRLPPASDQFPAGAPRWRCPDTRLRIRARLCGERSTLARKREASVTLPEGVERVEVHKKSGKVYTYFYWNPGRGTDREGERIKLPNADTRPRHFGPK